MERFLALSASSRISYTKTFSGPSTAGTASSAALQLSHASELGWRDWRPFWPERKHGTKGGAHPVAATCLSDFHARKDQTWDDLARHLHHCILCRVHVQGTHFLEVLKAKLPRIPGAWLNWHPWDPSWPVAVTTTLASMTCGSIQDCVSWFCVTRDQLVHNLRLPNSPAC